MPPRKKRGASRKAASAAKRRSTRKAGEQTEEKQTEEKQSEEKQSTSQEAESEGSSRATSPRSIASDASMTEKSSGRMSTAADAGSAEQSGRSPVLERGTVYFFYRPKVGVEHPKSADDVQRFYMLLSPEGVGETIISRPGTEEKVGDEKGGEEITRKHSQVQGEGKKHRLIIIASKMLPDPGTRHGQAFAFVEAASSSLKEVEENLARYEYTTKTRGDRTVESARFVAEGKYEIVQHDGQHTHFFYVIEIPRPLTEVQRQFHIHEEGTYLVQVKNPNRKDPSGRSGFYGLQDEHKAQFPPQLMTHFQGKVIDEVKFAPLLPEFLDYRGCELVFISTGKAPVSEFPAIVKELEKQVQEEERQIEKETKSHPEQHAYKELGMDEKEHPDATKAFV